jgi:rhamnogalacturonyl hydrolase YesR
VNETITKGMSMADRNLSVAEIIRVVADNMLKTRPKGEVEYYPYTHSPFIKNKLLGYIEVDFNQFHPDAKNGDAAFAKTVISSPADYEMLIRIENAEKFWLNGKEFDAGANGGTNIPVFIKKGENELIMKTVKYEENGFILKYCVSLRRYPGMWACDYIHHVEALCPIPGFEYENGTAVSGLIQDNKEPQYIFPKKSKIPDIFDFNKLIENGKTAYALTYLSGSFTIETFGETAVFITGQLSQRTKEKGIITISAENNAEILIKCFKSGNVWGFRYISGNGLSLPFVKTAGEKGLKFIFSGGYGNENTAFSTPFAPEFGIDFTKPMPDGRGGRLYWRFNRENTYLRPRLETSFFGQWFYALMVGLYGLKAAGEALDETSCFEYFNGSVTLMASYFDLMKYDAELFENPPFLQRAMEAGSLDSIGTMGVNLAECYNMTGNKELFHLAQLLAKQAQTLVPKKPDGSFYRVKTMWADDIYMSCPFLARMGQITGNWDFYDEAALQLKNYKKWLWLSGENLFSHIYFTEEDAANRIPWGRGNGWIFLTLSDILNIIPKSHKDYNGLLVLFKDHAKGILKHFNKGPDGAKMWRQVINEPGSYLETSATGMFITGFARGVQNGWLDGEYKDAALLAWQGLCENSIGMDGAVYGVCMGSGCSMDKKYYFDIPTIINDDHGTGIILLAASEIINFFTKTNYTQNDKNTVKAQNQLKENQYISPLSHENLSKQKSGESPNGTKALFVGNSITRHGPNSDIGWNGDWGMAASVKENDYVHLVSDWIIKKDPNAEFLICQVVDWERNYKNGSEKLYLYEKARDFNADIIIMRIIENCPAAGFEYGAFIKEYTNLINWLNPQNKAKIILTTGFWKHPGDAAILEIAAGKNYPVINLGEYGEDDKMKAIGLFSHTGVANHPGDKGMKAIADEIINLLIHNTQWV